MHIKPKHLIIVLNPNKGDIFFNKNCISFKTLCPEICRSIFALSIGSSDNAYEYVKRSASHIDVALWLTNFVAAKNEDIYLTDLYWTEQIAFLKSYNTSCYILLLNPSKEVVTKNLIDKFFLEVYLWADYYMNVATSQERTDQQLSRFNRLIHGEAAVNIPTTQEKNMYIAYNAMYNSHCLSRAVGSCITTSTHELITDGWNDVPQAGGGVYERNHTNHCFRFHNPMTDTTSVCHKDLENKAIIEEIKLELEEQGVALTERDKLIIEAIGKSQIKGLLEFSRSVHAEMFAIIKASQIAGEKIKESILYVTAFPCHNCARHIVLSGVRIIYFMEPFLKSRALKLHNDSLEFYNDMDEIGIESNKVILLHHQGVGGKSFERFFHRSGDMKKKISSGQEYHF